MDEFSLRWRWTDPKWNLLPSDVLASIQPLKVHKANELDTILENLLKPIPLRIVGRTGTQLQSAVDKQVVESFDTSGEQPGAYKWLCEVLPSPDGSAFISWDNDTAALVRLATFIDYWDDFCYPLSADVAILPFSGDWILYYWHEEVLYFWKR
ncbi:MAG: hypothetical protein RH917_17800 [Lacipirellulaceae bacterium]